MSRITRVLLSLPLVGLPLASWATSTLAGPEPAAAEAPAAGTEGATTGAEAAGGAEAGATAEPAAASTKPVAIIRQEMEDRMAELGDLAANARRDTDLVRAACVLEKEERAQGVMELATSELLVIRDSAATEQQRGFAAEKLAAANERLDGLVKQAKECTGDTTPEVEDDLTDNDESVVPLIPEADPTQSGGTAPQPTPVPPSVDDQRPPTVGSPSK
jgi:hypothetical protein